MFTAAAQVAPVERRVTAHSGRVELARSEFRPASTTRWTGHASTCHNPPSHDRISTAVNSGTDNGTAISFRPLLQVLQL